MAELSAEQAAMDTINNEKRLNERIVSLETALTAEEAKVAELRGERESLEKALEQRHIELETDMEKFKELYLELAALRKDKANLLQRWRDTIEVVESENTDLRKDLDRERKYTSAAILDYNDMKAELAARDKAIGVAVELAKNEAMLVRSWIVERLHKDMKDRIITSFEEIATKLEAAVKKGGL